MEGILEGIRTGLAGGEARRLVYGRGGSYAGFDYVNIDYFKPVVLVSLYQSCSSAWIDALAGEIRRRLPGIEGIGVQTRQGAKVDFKVVWGRLPQTLWAHEAGLRFRLDFERGQNIGFFLDMRRVRAWVREKAASKRVLNLFAYTCGFSLAALAGGARQVLNVDMSGPSLAIGRQNHLDNKLDLRAAGFLKHEIFRSTGKLKRMGQWGLVIVDPPTWQPGSFLAKRDYPRLLRRLPALLAPGGLVLACLNATDLDSETLRNWCVKNMADTELVERLGPPGEFCQLNEERGLKVMVFKRK